LIIQAGFAELENTTLFTPIIPFIAEEYRPETTKNIFTH